MDASKCTQGPCVIRGTAVVAGDGVDVARTNTTLRPEREQDANAKLIAEAFNVATETDRSPIELADWQAQASTVLARMSEWMEDNMVCQCEHGHICYECDLLSEAQVLLRDAGAI